MKVVLSLLALVLAASCMPADVAVAPKKMAANYFCGICKDLVQECETEGEADAEAWLTAHIQKYCDELGFLSSLCMNEFKDVIEELAAEVNAKASPDVCCTKVKLC